MVKWRLEVFENGVWVQYGNTTSDFKKLYAMAQKICDNGSKARVVRVKEV